MSEQPIEFVATSPGTRAAPSPAPKSSGRTRTNLAKERATEKQRRTQIAETKIRDVGAADSEDEAEAATAMEIGDEGGTISKRKRTFSSSVHTEQDIKRRRVQVPNTATKDTETQVGEKEPAEAKSPLLGGENAIIISAPDNRPDIALLTLTPQSQQDLDGDYLYQTLTKIRTNEIFKDLMSDVAAVKPASWQAALAEHKQLPDEQRMPEEVLTAYGTIPDTVGAVVLDRADFDELEYDAEGERTPAALYIAPLHLVELGQAEESDLPVGIAQGGNYWLYMKNTLFELCNATHRNSLRKIDEAATSGDLNYDTYALAKETVEFSSEERFDKLWRQVVVNEDCRTVIDEQTNDKVVLNPSKEVTGLTFAKVGTTQAARLRNTTLTGHAGGYLHDWNEKYADKYRRRDYDIVEQVTELTGIAVTPKSAADFQRYAEQAVADPLHFEAETADDHDYVDPTERKPRRAGKGRTGDGATETGGDKSAKGRKKARARTKK